jgi:Domain of unknown function (DUF4156)
MELLMSQTSVYLGIVSLILLSGCSTVKLSEAGSKVNIVQAEEIINCKNLGQVVGTGGGGFRGGHYTSNDSLMNYALNDIKNKAAEKGSTHVVTAGLPQFVSHNGITSSAIVVGTAYQCK